MKTSRASLWSVAPTDRPREKLQRLGPAALSEAELVALVLGSGMRGVNVLDSAQLLLQQSGGVTELMRMTVGELMSLMGVGVATAGRVVAVAELWRRAHTAVPGRHIAGPDDVAGVVRDSIDARNRAAERLAIDPTENPPSRFVVVVDEDLRVSAVVPVQSRPPGSTSGVQGDVAAILHEVLYRGGTAFGVALVEGTGDAEGVHGDRGDETDERLVRDVLRLAAQTVGLRYLSTVVLSESGWRSGD